MKRLRLVFRKRWVSKCTCGPSLFGEMKTQLVADTLMFIETIALRYSTFDRKNLRVCRYLALLVQAYLFAYGH